MAHTLFDFSVILPLILHFASGENIDLPTRYAPDSNFASVDNTKTPDQNSEATLFGESEPFGTQDRGNFFMYQHVPKPDHYEFAYRRGNEHHIRQHHEKAAPHVGHFKIQTRWGDKHGGYGEHYWDYNHGGDAHEEGSNNEEIFDPSQSQDEKTIAYASTPSTDSRAPLQISETHKTEQKERKKYYNKPSKPKYEEIRQKKIKYSQTESPKQEYFDIPKVKSRPYDKEYSPVESKIAHHYQNVDLYSQNDEFPVMYDTTKTPSTTANYDHVQSLKSYSYDPQIRDGYVV